MSKNNNGTNNNGTSGAGSHDDADFELLFERLYNTTRDQAVSRASHRGDEDAEGRFHEAFVSLWLKPPEDLAVLTPGLHLRLHSRCCSAYRRNLRRREHEQEFIRRQSLEVISKEGEQIRRAKILRVRFAMRGLRAVEQEVLRLRFWEEYTPTAIATLLQLPLPTIKSYLFRAKCKLRVRLLRSFRRARKNLHPAAEQNGMPPVNT